MTVCKHIVIGPKEEGLAAGEFSASFLSPKYVFFCGEKVYEEINTSFS